MNGFAGWKNPADEAEFMDLTGWDRYRGEDWISRKPTFGDGAIRGTHFGGVNGAVPGTYWGNGKYQVVEGDPSQPNWASRVPPGYELAASRPSMQDNHFPDSPRQLPGSMVLKRVDPPAPPPAADPEPARRPPAEPRPSSPSVYAAAPSLADALAGQEEKERRRDGASRPGLQAALDSALRINRREPADWRDAGSGRAADGASGGEDDRDRPGRRFAASSRWRSQLDAVRRRLDEDQAISFA